MATLRKLGRPTAHRKATLRNLTTDVPAEGRITTTVTRAKGTRRLVEKMITLGKRGDLHAKRQALAYIHSEDVVTELFEEITPRYADRNDGYTRILRMGPRRGDSTEMTIIKLV